MDYFKTPKTMKKLKTIVNEVVEIYYEVRARRIEEEKRSAQTPNRKELKYRRRWTDDKKSKASNNNKN